ncbi:oxygen-independent coproporphyrinogen III oxidase [Coralloluteibacterium thermophilus]|uniref:Coproporphyrinogen-III oxidase n=1 Tax=Coralloluteibacterium thermophilum TaxID=2707049 RepID=A0ABV9NP89_9GAMM
MNAAIASFETRPCTDDDAALPPSLLARYGRPVPRYTSYPTAVQFGPLRPGTYAAWLAAVPAEEAVSLYLHVPYCAALCWYCGCRTQATRNHRERVSVYVDDLIAEIDLVAAALGRRQPVAAVHFGGGTPNLLSLNDLERLLDHLRLRFAIADDAELAMEIDPRELGAEYADALGRAGFRRISLGIQDFDAEVQRLIHREQPYPLVEQSVEWLRAAGVEGINFDLIYGLPGQTEESVRETLRLVSALRPDRIALYGYAHLPQRQRHQRLIPEDRLPDAALRHRLQRLAQDELAAQGYVAVGMDHFALPHDRLVHARVRNFQGYSTDTARTLVGLGASAIGQFAQGYAQNQPATALWRDAVRNGSLPTARGLATTADDVARRAVIERLMCDLEAPLEAIAREHGFEAGALIEDPQLIADLVRDGLAWIADGRIGCTPRGRSLVRTLCSAFDRYAHGGARHAPAV